MVTSGLTLIDPVCFVMFLPHLVRKTLLFESATKAAKPAESTPTKSSRFYRWFPMRNLMKGMLVMWFKVTPIIFTALQKKMSIKSLFSFSILCLNASDLHIHIIISGLVVREMHCAAALCRNFQWTDLNLWTSELPSDSVVVLGGRDNMIPVPDIRQLLSSSAAASKRVRLIYEQDHAHGAFLLDGHFQESIIEAGTVPDKALPSTLVNPANTISTPFSSMMDSLDLISPTALNEFPTLMPSRLTAVDLRKQDMKWKIRQSVCGRGNLPSSRPHHGSRYPHRLTPLA